MPIRSPLSLVLVLATSLTVAPTAHASLVSALDDITEQMGGSGSGGSGNSSTSSQQPPAPPPAPAPSVPEGPEFGPADEPAAPESRVAPEPSPVSEGRTTTDPETGISTTVVEKPDGSRIVTQKDKDGRVLKEEFFPPGSDTPDAVKELDPETGNTTTTAYHKDGSKSILTTNSDGFLVGEKYEEAPRASASMYDPETGTTMTSVKNADGSRTVTKTDKDGNILAQETLPAPGKGGASASAYDPKTGQTTTSTLNSDGSRSVVTKDKQGNVVSESNEPAPGQGQPFVSTTDPKTGVTTTVRGNPDGTRTVSESRTWKDKDGQQHTVVTDNRGNQTEIVREKDGTVRTTQWDREDRQVETIRAKDGSETVRSRSADGQIVEKTTRKDGTVETVRKDDSGNVLRTTRTGKDGVVTVEDEFGVTSERKPRKDGGYTVERTDAQGNKTFGIYEEGGKLVYDTEERKVPREPGQAYFENELGGKMGEWEDLPQSVKTQYANSEAQIKESIRAELLRQEQEEERRIAEMKQEVFEEDLRRRTEEKLAAIEREAEEAKAAQAERARREELWTKRREVDEKMREYDRKIYEAVSRGDTREAERLKIEADTLHDASVDLYDMTPEEQAAAERRQAVRDRITQRVGSTARSIADNEMQATEGLQELKEEVTGKAKWLSIGAEMQEQTKRTTRMADRELAYAAAKQAEIARLLEDPRTTAEEKEVLYEMLDMADLQEAGARGMLKDNAMLTAAGYGLDVATTVTGAKLATAGTKAVTATATRFLAKETAEAVVVKTTETGLVKLAGEGVTKAATTTAGKVSGEQAALAVEKALTADVGKAAATAAESAGTRVLGEKGVETVKTAATKAAEIASTNVSDIPGALKGSEGKSLADTWADDAVADVTAAGERKYADRTMPLETLEDYAKNPRVRTAERPAVLDDFPSQPIPSNYRRPDFVQARSAWKKVPKAEREAFDRQVREAIDEAAAMGDKWAKRVQQDLNSGKIKYEYEPGLDAVGVAPGNGSVILNPMGRGRGLESPDKMASALVHEYAHSWKGPQKYASAQGKPVEGSAYKGEYNEVRAFMAEASFNKNLRAARDLNGKAFDESTVKELDALMGVDSLPSGPPSTARGLEARKNLQEGLVDEYQYGRDYEKDLELGMERLSTFRGGSMRDIRERLNKARGTPEYDRILDEIRDAGGRVTPKKTAP
ncbi:MAG: hypothetical protein MOGMAGMI_01613 [Candidatus Omnitrophica bacterium]|nr:hypothetical protein [Candidatus Omnitrophota bacterium]